MYNSLQLLSLPDDGELPEFVDCRAAADHACVSCREVVRRPVQTPCGHRLCDICLDDLLRDVEPSTGRVSCPAGEESCADITSREDCPPDMAERKELKLLLVYCLNKSYGCSEQMSWAYLQEHVDCCQYTPHPCPSTHHSCKEVLPLFMLPDHVEKCDSRNEECPECQTNMEQIKIKLSQSVQQYLCRTIPKIHYVLEEWASYQHLVLIELKDKTTEINIQIQKVLKLEGTCTSCMKTLDSYRSRMLKLEIWVVTNKEKVERMEKHTMSLVTKEEVLEIKKLSELKEKLNMTESSLASKGTYIATCSEEEASSEIVAEVNRHKGLLDMFTMTMDSSVVERLNSLETASYNGILIWKIKRYTQHRENAKSGNKPFLVSPAFYTGYHGYKMAAKVYLDGDGAGRGSHLSLYFMLMQGEYDALLPWPFRQKVIMEVLDQVNHKHARDSFHPNIRDTSFQRPQTKQNIPCGCQTFAPLNALDTRDSPYVRNDTVYIKVTVDTKIKIK